MFTLRLRINVLHFPCPKSIFSRYTAATVGRTVNPLWLHRSVITSTSSGKGRLKIGDDLKQRHDEKLASNVSKITVVRSRDGILTDLNVNKFIECHEPPPGENKQLDSPTVSAYRDSMASLRKRFIYYLRLAKFRLSGLVVLTSLCGFAMSPLPFDLTRFACCAVGTGLAASCANALNQLLEMNYDAQMTRTKARPLVLKQLSPPDAAIFAILTGVGGVSLLAGSTTGITASLALSNVILYAFVYTPMKRRHVACTWIGAVVGAIPPIMGWTAAGSSMLDPGCLLLAVLLYSWQFPHFNALSWTNKSDYVKAGYKMMASENPELCKRVAFRHCAMLNAVCLLMPLSDLTNWYFAALALPLNAAFTYKGYQFYKESNSKTSRELFRLSLLYLPVMICLMLFCKSSEEQSKRFRFHNINGLLYEKLGVGIPSD